MNQFFSCLQITKANGATPSCLWTTILVTKGDNLCEILFASVVDRIIQEKSLLLQERIFSNKGKNLLLKEQTLNHIEKGGKKETDRGLSCFLLVIMIMKMRIMNLKISPCQFLMCSEFFL